MLGGGRLPPGAAVAPFIAALIICWLAARIAANQPRVLAAFRFLLDLTGVRRLSPAFGWLGRRFDPRLARGLGLTVGFLALIGAVAAIGLCRAAAGTARARAGGADRAGSRRPA